ncbi:MAG: T9SS type A sorting domain-containing protein [Bacteroidota bacterium]
MEPITFVAGVGTFPIVYTFSDGNGCSGTVTESITVHPAPSVALIGLADACEDVASIPLSGGSPAGGTYSGMGVSGGQFMPASVGPGTYTITYDFSDGNGCSNSATSTITVNALPTVTHSALSDVCENAGLVSLSGGSPAGGTYSGPGISGGDFDPAVVGPGTYQIDYTFTDGNSCSDFETVAITVLAAPNATLTAAADTVCLDASMITLTGMPMGGTFSGPGVTGNMFDPDAAGAGTAPISYVFTDGSGCSDTAETIVVVSGLPTVSLSAASNAICENEAPITLTASPAGGTLSGPGVNGGSFDPALAGVGVFELVYEYTDNTSCSNSDTFSIEVFAAPTASFAPDADSVCINDAPISLNGAPTEGIFSGGGVSGDQFDPMMAGIGTQSITYLFTDANGCSDSSSLNVEVLPQAETPVISNDGQIMSVSSAADSFQWFLNGVAIPGETGSTYLPGDTGSTATVVAYLNGCASDTSGGKLTARDLLFGQAELVLFPNPSTAQVELHLHQLPVRGELHLDLLDIQGRLVFQRLDQVNGDDFQTTFDFSSLARGLYLLRISQEGQLIGSQKLRLE